MLADECDWSSARASGPGGGGGGWGGQAGDGCDDCALTVRAQLRSSGVIFLILPVRRSLWFAASPRLCHLVLCFLLFSSCFPPSSLSSPLGLALPLLLHFCGFYSLRRKNGEEGVGGETALSAVTIATASRRRASGAGQTCVLVLFPLSLLPLGAVRLKPPLTGIKRRRGNEASRLWSGTFR